MTKEQLFEKFLLTLSSRKFWALVVSLVTVAAGYATGELQVWAAVTAAVSALAAYSVGTAIEDSGKTPPPAF
jgi:hypothetical protein